MATKSVDEQIAEHEAAIKKLKASKLEAYEAEYATVSARAGELRNLIGEIKGTPVHPEIIRPGKKPKADKPAGKLISALRLAELVKEAGGVLHLRGRKKDDNGYDMASAKKAVEESGGKFKFGPKGPWPTIVPA